jgi:F420-non-reducing hydrogenase small subunit
LDSVRDHGAKSISFIASLIDEIDPEKIAEVVSRIADPTGLFYRYSLAASLIGAINKRPDQNEGLPKEAS